MTRPRKNLVRVFDLHERRPIVVTIEPTGDVLFREKGRRVVYRSNLRTLFLAAVRDYAAREVEERRERRLARKEQR